MRPTRQIAAMLLVAACAAGGCSKTRDASPPEQDSTKAIAKPTTAASPGEAPAPTETDGEGFLPPATTTLAPMTFADGEAAYAAKKYADALAIFDAYVARRPNNPWGHYMLGLSAWKSGDVARAEEAFEKAWSLDPHHVKSMVNLSRMLLERERHDDALEALTRAADVAPDSIVVHRLLARTHVARGSIDEAVDAYRRAIELNERDAWSMNDLGLLFLEQRRYDEALPLFATAVELRREVPAFHNNLGMTLAHVGRLEEAAAAYSGALTADPGYVKAKQNLARLATR